MASKKEKSTLSKVIEHPVDTVLTKDKAEQHRRINTAIAAVGTGAGLLSAARLMRQKPGENVVKATKSATDAAQKVGGAAKDIQRATNESLLNRSSRAKAVRKSKKIRKAAIQKYLHNKRMAKMPKWRKLLNKLPGGKIKLFDNRVKQRVIEKAIVKDIAFALSRPELDDSLIDIANQGKRVHNRVTKNVKTARKAGSAVADIKDAIKGERRNKRRKRFYEKQAFKDRALATGITAGGLGLSYLASTKRGRALIKNYLESQGETIDFEHIAGHDWYTSRPTTTSVRVHTGGKRRKRRSKYWYEKKSNRDKMLTASAVAGTAGLGLAGLAVAMRRRVKRLGKHVDALKKNRTFQQSRRKPKSGGYTSKAKPAVNNRLKKPKNLDIESN
jgi:hypothetical protein